MIIQSTKNDLKNKKTKITTKRQIQIISRDIIDDLFDEKINFLNENYSDRVIFFSYFRLAPMKNQMMNILLVRKMIINLIY